MSLPQSQAQSLQIEHTASSDFHVFLLGDVGSGDERQLAVAEAMERRCQELPKLEAIFLLGDLFYMHGVSSVDDPLWKRNIHKPYSSPCLSRAKIYPIFGNHDYRGNKEAFFAYTQKNARWQMPHRFYSVNMSEDVKFIMLDSNFADVCLSPRHCVVDFLQQELNSSARWKFVLAHHPLRSQSPNGHSHSGANLFGYAFRWLTCGKATAWIAGHAHHLEHRFLDTCSVHHFISGGGGGDLEPILPADPQLAFASSQHGFLELRFGDGQAQATFYGLNLENLHRYQL